MLRLRLAVCLKCFERVVRWREFGWCSQFWIQNALYSSYEILYIAIGLTCERVWIHIDIYHTKYRLVYIIIIIYTWNLLLADWCFSGALFLFLPHTDKTRAKSTRVPFDIKQYVWIVGGERLFSFIYRDLKMCLVGFCRHNNVDTVTRVYYFLSGILW